MGEKQSNITRVLVCKHKDGYDIPFNVVINQNVFDERIEINGVKISVNKLQKIFEALHVELLDTKKVSENGI